MAASERLLKNYEIVNLNNYEDSQNAGDNKKLLVINGNFNSSKSVDWFQYDRDIHHKRVEVIVFLGY